MNPAQLPAWLIAVPLLAAPLLILLRKPALCRAVVGLVAAVQLFNTLTLLRHVLSRGPVSHHLGGWLPPIGIELRVDAVNSIVLLLLALIFAIVTPYMFHSSRREIPEAKTHLFYSLILTCMTGLTGMTITGDVFNVFVFLEISALSTYGLVAMGQGPRALTAALRYLILGTTGSTFFLLGLGLLLAATGTLNMLDLAERLPAVAESRVVLASLAFITVGIGLKLAIFPLHVWLPDAYAYAPASVTVLVAATATKVAFYVFCRILFTVFGGDIPFVQVGLQSILLPVGLAGVFAGSLAAFYQTDLKRLLAYSSVAQLGYMLVGIGCLSGAGMTGALVHVFNHAVMKAALFMTAGAFVYRLGTSRLDDLAGAGKKLPLTSSAFVLAGLSLIGVPLTVGFVSKWYLVLGALEAGRIAVAVALLLGSLLAVGYIWKVVETLYFKAPSELVVRVDSEAPAGMLIPTWMLAALCIGFGVFTETTVGIAELAATALGVRP